MQNYLCHLKREKQIKIFPDQYKSSFTNDFPSSLSPPPPKWNLNYLNFSTHFTFPPPLFWQRSPLNWFNYWGTHTSVWVCGGHRGGGWRGLLCVLIFSCRRSLSRGLSLSLDMQFDPWQRTAVQVGGRAAPCPGPPDRPCCLNGCLTPLLQPPLFMPVRKKSRGQRVDSPNALSVTKATRCEGCRQGDTQPTQHPLCCCVFCFFLP